MIKQQLLKLALFLRYTVGSFVALGFVLLPLYLIFVLKVTHGFHLGALMWSFFVLCIPIGITSSVFSIPFWFATGHSFRYAELFSWITAIALNYYTYYHTPTLYFKFASTHMLHRIITNPWPYWLIIASCALAMQIGRASCRERV